jgi:hypothetical protein
MRTTPLCAVVGKRGILAHDGFAGNDPAPAASEPRHSSLTVLCNFGSTGNVVITVADAKLI